MKTVATLSSTYVDRGVSRHRGARVGVTPELFSSEAHHLIELPHGSEWDRVALLFAASPDMEEAIKAAVERLEDGLSINPGDALHSRLCEVLAQASPED